MKDVLFALFLTMAETESVVQDLGGAGIPRETVSILRQNEEVENVLTKDKMPEVKFSAAQGAGAGAVGGATAGVIGGILLSVTGPLGFIPGLLTIAVTGMGGSLVGAVAGGLSGALVGVGFPESIARAYEKGITEGKILLGTTVDDYTEEKVRKIYDAYNGERIQKIPVIETAGK